MKYINQIQPWIDKQEANYIKKIVSKTYLTENKETQIFEKNLKKKFRSQNCIAISNWTSGIFICLKAINIKPGDEIIVPNLTFIATATPIIWCGAKIVLCDVDYENFSIDLNKLKANISFKGGLINIKASKTSNLPQMHGFQAKNPQTIASAIRIKTPASWKGALNAAQESNGSLKKVSDDEILEAYRLLASEEGIFCEPASAASVAGLLNISKQINLNNKTIVCIITGSGLKDPDTALNNTNNKVIDLEASHDNLAEILQNIHEIIK